MKRWLLAFCAVALPSCGAVNRPDAELVETVEVLLPRKEEMPGPFDLDLSADPMKAKDLEKGDPASPAAEDFAAGEATPGASSEMPAREPSAVPSSAAPGTPLHADPGLARKVETPPTFRCVLREGLPSGFNMVPPGYDVQTEASSWEELVERADPTLLLGDWEMLWVERDGNSRLRFVINRAFVVVPEDSKPRWVLLTGRGAHWWIGAFANRSVSALCESPPVHDTGPGDYAVVLSRGPDDRVLYEVGREHGPCGSGNVVSGRRFYVFGDHEGNWRFIGEGPEEVSGKLGYGHGYGHSVRRTVRWTGDTQAPVRLEFISSRSDAELGEGQIGLPYNVVYRDCVLEGQPPATLREGGRWYALVKRGETLDDVVYRQAVWSSGWSSRKDQQKTALGVWRDAILRLNPGLDPAEIREGARIELPTYGEISGAFKAARAASQLEGTWEALRAKEGCLCTVLGEPGSDWRSFIRTPPSPETMTLLMSRLGSAHPTGTAGCTTGSGRLTEGELALYAAKIMLRRLAGRGKDVGVFALMRRRLPPRKRRDEAEREILADPAAREELKKHLLDLYAAVSNLQPGQVERLAQAVLRKGGGQ
jgi:hypothetical protein